MAMIRSRHSLRESSIWDGLSHTESEAQTSTQFSTLGGDFSETSTIRGIGMLSGRAIKVIGQTTINLVENQAMRRRLRKIHSLLDQDGQGFASLPLKDQEDVVAELDELCW